jgi:hypothetical protein
MWRLKFIPESRISIVGLDNVYFGLSFIFFCCGREKEEEECGCQRKRRKKKDKHNTN